MMPATVWLLLWWLQIDSAHSQDTTSHVVWCRELESGNMSWARKFGNREWCRFSGYNTDPKPMDLSDVADMGWPVYVQFRWVFELTWASQFSRLAAKWLWWCVDQFGITLFGDETWSLAKSVVYLALLSTILMMAMCGLDLIGRPLVYAWVKLSALYRWVRGVVPDQLTITVHELQWRGPDTAHPVDNEYYRDEIRARNLDNRMPNNIVLRMDQA